ncbi:MAG: hypothetical protein Q4G03_05415 [Planctomycetia bacterium]|nr:hypothetical protein [Planctomycetia bacterium]
MDALQDTNRIMSQATRRRCACGVRLFLVALAFIALGLNLSCRRSHDPESVSGGTAERPVDVGASSTMSAEQLLRETAFVYASAKYYHDSGYVEALCERAEERGVRAYRARCSVAFAKPNYLRLALGEARLTCNGTTMRAQIHNDAYAGQALEIPAPYVVSAIKELYPDPIYAQFADVGVPRNLFWTAPQLILLLAKDPIKTLAPQNAKLTLLQPKRLLRDGERPRLCQRVLISAEDGDRVLWIDNESKALTRCELPTERLMAPEPDARVVALTMEFPEIELQSSAPQDFSEFQFTEEPQRRVERFLAPELDALYKSFPLEALRSLDERDDSPAGLPNLDRNKFNLLCFWSTTDPMRFSAFQTLEELQDSAELQDRFNFLAVDVDSDATSDLYVLAESAAAGLDVPLARLNDQSLVELTANFPQPKSLTFLLLNPEEQVLFYHTSRITSSQLRLPLLRALEGRDLPSESFNAYYDLSRRFVEFMARCDAADLYRDWPDAAATTSIPARSLPRTFDLHEAWRFDGLVAPCNPLAISRSTSFSDGNSVDLVSNSPPTDTTAETDENLLPLASREPLPEEFLVVPCDGNVLVIITTKGRLVRKTTSAAVAGEPITFVRATETPDARRWFLASATLQSRKVCRFNDAFDDLGALDFGRFSGQWVGDARFCDADADGSPELYLSLLAQPSTDGVATRGVYAVDLTEPRMRWKNETLVAPGTIGFTTEEPGRRALIWTSDWNSDESSALACLDPKDGSIVRRVQVSAQETLEAFGASTNVRPGQAELAVLLYSRETSSYSLVGYSSQGEELWRAPAQSTPSDFPLERVSACDLNNDGYDEWMLASPEGTIQFFSGSGELIDSFQYGAEITGATVAHWSGQTYLIVTDLTKVSAWKASARR